MRIAFFTDSYKPDLSGLVVAVDTFRQELKNLGHEVVLFAPQQGKYRDEDGDIYRFPSLRCMGKLKNYYLAYPLAPQMRKIFNSMRPDIVHVHTPFTMGFLGLRWAKKFDIPTVTTFHTHFEEYIHYVPLPRRWGKAFARWSTKDFCNKCDGVIAPGTATRIILKNYGIEKPIHIIPSGIQWQDYQGYDRKEARRKFGFNDDDIVLIYLGRVAREKNIPFLFDVVAELLGKAGLSKRIKFMLIGGGPELESIKQIARDKKLSEHVIFTGMIPKEKTAEHYAAGDIFIYSSVTETQGLVVAEAMASGLPVVAVRAMGVEDAVKDGQDGFLCPLDLKEFLAKLELLITDANLRMRFAKQARTDAQDFSSRRMSEKLVELYKDLIKART